jgi:DNA mismatch endonuclease (patch repair protein)
MRGNRGRDTTPELALRSALHRLGYRYRVDRPPVASVRRKADMVFTRRRVAVFLDGCYWHGCPDHFRLPSTNTEYWHDKIAGNQRRDRDTDQRLREAGWTPVRVWEHEPLEHAIEQVTAALDAGPPRQR